MTLPNERYRAILNARQFLLSVLVLPRIPTAVRMDARSVLKHYPTSYDLDMIARNLPEILEKPNDDR